MSKKYKDHYLPVEVIIAATQGEAAAIQTVLKTYESYIRNKRRPEAADRQAKNRQDHL